MLKIHVSLGNSKLGRIANISLPPIQTCRVGTPCHRRCYAIRSWQMSANVRKAWQENLDVYKSDSNVYFEQIRLWLYENKPRFFRFHVAGDIPDAQYWQGLLALCSRMPMVKFLVFTKRFDLDFSMKSPNLSVVLSMWPGMADPRHLDLPRAWCQDGTEDRVPAGALECPGDCINCGACWGLAKRGIDVVFPLH